MKETQHNAKAKCICAAIQQLNNTFAAFIGDNKLPNILIIVVLITSTISQAAELSVADVGLSSPTPKRFPIIRNSRQTSVENSSLVTQGFIDGSGKQYEKATVVVVNTCPKECSCLGTYFGCRSNHLNKVPQLPNYVQVLDLAKNKLNDSIADDIANLTELTRLSLKRNLLSSIPKFVGLTALKNLNLAHNNIQGIFGDDLEAFPKLKVLDLSKNNLRTIEWNSFPNRSRIASLLLSHNNIVAIEDHALDNLGELIDLDLNNNRLSSLAVGLFKSLNKLKKLLINNNNLEINWSTFKGLHSLQTLSLKSNNIRSLQDGVFHVLRSIESIELDGNGITSLSRRGLFNLTKLHYLSLSNNSISRIELDTWEFTQSLVSLDLSHNNITEFNSQHLDCLQRLKFLNLGHNQIHYLFENTFDCVKNVEELILRRNKLSWIIEDQLSSPPFKSLKKLKVLDLYGNNLKQINAKSLNGLANLENINLGGNPLATIQASAFDHMIHLQKLVFSSTNFICDCNLLWLWKWLHKNKQLTTDHANAVCGYPENLRERELMSVPISDLRCVDTPKPVLTSEPINQLAVKGANLTMECTAKSHLLTSPISMDELKINWRHDNQNIREKGQSASNNSDSSSTKIDTELHTDEATNRTMIRSQLHLFNVSYDSAGRYQCLVSNTFGTTYSQKFKMTIGIHPSFLQVPTNLTIDSGDTARLVCSATGDPVPEIALQKYGAADFPAATERRLQVIREENAFVITNAKPIDTGIYTCTAESAAGEIKVNASLIVNDIPIAGNPVVRKEIVLGESSVIECLGSGDLLRPHRDWYKENKPFHFSATSTSDRHYFTAEKELLIIVNTQSTDSGMYKCEIYNSTKTISMYTELIVVKADLNKNVIIIGVALVTIACVFIGSLVVWLILFYQKRKLYFRSRGLGGRNRRSDGGDIGGDNVSDGSRAAVLDQTQLTTITNMNRTLLHHHHHHHNRQNQSISNIDPLTVSEEGQRNYLIVTPSQNYQQLQRQRDRESIPLEYLVSESGGTLAELDLDQNQDHLSSKDSGTGSDAAVKRSIDDFTISLLPADEHHPVIVGRDTYPRTRPTTAVALAHPDTDNDDDDGDFTESAAVGISDYDEIDTKQIYRENRQEAQGGSDVERIIPHKQTCSSKNNKHSPSSRSSSCGSSKSISANNSIPQQPQTGNHLQYCKNNVATAANSLAHNLPTAAVKM